MTTARQRKTKRARQAQARRLYRRLDVRLKAQYQGILAALEVDDVRRHLVCATAFSRTLARITRVQTLSGVAWNWDKGFASLARKAKGSKK